MGHYSSKNNYSKKAEIFDTKTLIEPNAETGLETNSFNPFQDILNYEEAFKKIEQENQELKQEQEIKKRQQLKALENTLVIEIQKQITSDKIGKLGRNFNFFHKVGLNIDYNCDYNYNCDTKDVDILIEKLNIHLFKKGWKINKWDIYPSSCFSIDQKTQIYIELKKH